MNRKGLLKHLIYLMFFIFLADIIAKKFYWYSSIWWFDMLMHFLGGLWVAWFFLYVFVKNELLAKQFLLLLGGVLLIGLCWEFFEFFTFNNIGRDKFNILDTTSDLFFDLSGGIVAVLYYLRRAMRIKENTIQ